MTPYVQTTYSTNEGHKQIDRRSLHRKLETLIRKTSFPLLGLLVCLHILNQLPASVEFKSENRELERMRVKSGNVLEIELDHTYSIKDLGITPLFQRIYGKDYLSIHHQGINFRREKGAVLYVQYASAKEAKWAKENTEEMWGLARPMEARAIGNFLVRVTGSEVIFHDLAELVFLSIEENLAVEGD